MTMINSISIKCKGSRYIKLSELKDFQGNLKELDETNFNKCKESLIEYGYRIPIMVWENNILDGHQKVFVLHKLITEGYEIDKIPVIDIEAKDKKEAKEILLLINSNYGEITKKGLSDFIENEKLNLEKLKRKLNFSGINLNELRANFFKKLDDGKNRFYQEEDMKYFKKIHIISIKNKNYLYFKKP